MFKFKIDCFFAKSRLYRWLMWKLFGRRYYYSEFKYANLTPDARPEYIVFFKRE